MTGSAKSMLISTLVLLAACLVWVSMAPQPESVPRSVPDPTGVAREIGGRQSWTVSLPAGLGKDWVPTNVTLIPPKDKGQQPTWHAGYQGPDDEYVALEQTRAGTPAWISEQTLNGAAEGTSNVGGAVWERHHSSEKERRSLVRRDPLHGLTTVVIGNAEYGTLEKFAAALRPVPAGSPGSSSSGASVSGSSPVSSSR